MIPVPYDLHIHTCLSPCGDKDMTPANIVGMAFLKGLKVIAITDHNTCLNCAPAMKHGADYGITVIPGMELTTSEEVHVVCLFSSLEKALAFSSYVYNHLLDIENKPKIFGEQLILNDEDEPIGEVKRLLISATDISFDDIPALMETFQGIWFPSHIEKTSTSVLSNLGFIPPDSPFDIVEIKDYKKTRVLCDAHPHLKTCKKLFNSDAHYLWQIGTGISE